MTGQLGVAIASMFTGQLSDKAGRKNIILLSTLLAAIGSIVKYFLRKTFWGFCIANFCTGLATGSLPVAMAYVGDVFVSNADIQSEMSAMVGLWMLGGAGGGILAILLESTGLFTPLLLAAALMFVAAIVLSLYFIEPGDLPALEIEPSVLNEDEEDEDIDAPEEIDQCALWNIVG
jgi:MFS family permease